MDAVSRYGTDSKRDSRKDKGRRFVLAVQSLLFSCNAPDDNPFMAGAFPWRSQKMMLLSMSV